MKIPAAAPGTGGRFLKELPIPAPRADAVAFIRRVASHTRDIGLARTAASLSFTTLLGLIPLATVAFSFVARFPIFQQWLDALEGSLLRYMLPDSANTVVHTYIREFTEKAAALTGVSIVFIGVTAVLLIATVEREINAIWGITRARPLARRLVVYALGATAGPVLVGASISATTWILAQSLARHGYAGRARPEGRCRSPFRRWRSRCSMRSPRSRTFPGGTRSPARSLRRWRSRARSTASRST